jgi:hypothetical protein
VRDLPRHQEAEGVLHAGIVTEVDETLVNNLGPGLRGKCSSEGQPAVQCGNRRRRRSTRRLVRAPPAALEQRRRGAVGAAGEVGEQLVGLDAFGHVEQEILAGGIDLGEGLGEIRMAAASSPSGPPNCSRMRLASFGSGAGNAPPRP